MKKILVLILTITLFLSGCTKNEEKKFEPEHVDENPIVTMNIKDYGTIVMELYPNEVYNTVANFVTLVENGFYNNNVITRVHKNFVIQAGGGKTLDYSIEGEFASNGKVNNISHERGVVSMARTPLPNSASGQFFILLEDSTYLDGDYAAFGRVIEGMDVADKIAEKEYDYADESMGALKPEDYITIESATVDTKGYKYEVNKIKNNSSN